MTGTGLIARSHLPRQSFGDLHAAQPPRVRESKVALGLAVGAIIALPLLRPQGPGNTAPIVDVLIALVCVTTLYWSGTAHVRVRLPYAVPVAMLVAGGSIAALAHEQSTTAVTALVQDVVLLVWCGALTTLAVTARAIQVLLRTWVLSSVGWATVMVTGVVTHQAGLAGITAREGSRAMLTFGDPNVAANFFVVSFMLVLATRYPRRRAPRLACCLVLIAAVVVTGSNGGMVSLLVGAAIVGVAAFFRRFGIVQCLAMVCLVSGSGLVFVVVTGVSIPGYISSVRQAAKDNFLFHDSVGRASQSEQTRGLLLSEAVTLYRDSSFLGIGPAATKQTLIDRQALYVKEAHSDYIAALVERGLFGALGLLALIGVSAVRGRSAVRGSNATGNRALADVVPCPTALVAGLVTFALAGAFYEVLHFRHLWAFLGIVAALGYVAGRDLER